MSNKITRHDNAIIEELKHQCLYERQFDGWEELYPRKDYTYKDLQNLYIGGILRAMEIIEAGEFEEN